MARRKGDVMNVMDEVRAWCEDAFSDCPEDASDQELIDCVRGQYDGGWAGFLRDLDGGS